MKRTSWKLKIDYFKSWQWGDSVFKKSPPWIQPLYIERYKGRRTSNLESSHNFWEILALKEGNMTYFADRKIEAEEGEIILTPPKIIHKEYSPKVVDTFWMGFKADIQDIPKDRATVLNSQDILEAVSNLWLFSIRNNSPMMGTELDAMFMLVLGIFSREMKSSLKSSESAFRDAIQYIHENFYSNISISKLAFEHGSSEGYFFKKFKKITGKPPIKYLNEIRVKKACFYLKNTNYKINQIADMCGFNDPYYFSRVFKKMIMISPQKYRNNQKAE